jgi:hypothetical protein
MQVSLEGGQERVQQGHQILQVWMKGHLKLFEIILEMQELTTDKHLLLGTMVRFKIYMVKYGPQVMNLSNHVQPFNVSRSH